MTVAAPVVAPNAPSWLADLNHGRDAAAQITFDAEIPFGPSMRVRRYRLGNGLAILLLTDKAAPVVAYHTWFLVGSRDEQPGKTGLAHFFEHLMFNETTSLAAGEFDRVLEENGAETNAATWVDWTYYHEASPASKLPLLVKLEADRMHNLVLRQKQVDSEREVVANERRYRVEDDVEGSVSELLYKTAFTTHPYKWPTIGWMKDIEGYTPADCEAFYRRFYAPNNACVVVAGDVDEQAALKLMQDHYGPLPSSVLPTRALPKEPPQTSERRVEIDKPTATEKLMIGYRGPALADRDFAPLNVLNEILFGGRASRIYRRLIKEREIASDVRGWITTFADPGLYEMYVTARGEHTTIALEAELEIELARVRDALVSEEELVRAKSRLELGLLQGLETAAGKAEQIGFFQTTLGDPSAAFTQLEAYRAVTLQDLQRVARTWLVSSARTVIRVKPDGSAGSDDDDGDDEDNATDEADVETGAAARKLSKVSR